MRTRLEMGGRMVAATALFVWAASARAQPPEATTYTAILSNHRVRYARPNIASGPSDKRQQVQGQADRIGRQASVHLLAAFGSRLRRLRAHRPYRKLGPDYRRLDLPCRQSEHGVLCPQG